MAFQIAYDRNFLLKFQSVTFAKPGELPELDVILSKPTEAHRRVSNYEYMNDFVRSASTARYKNRTPRILQITTSETKQMLAELDIEENLERSEIYQNYKKPPNKGNSDQIQHVVCSKCSKKYSCDGQVLFQNALTFLVKLDAVPSNRRKIFNPCGHGACPSCAVKLKQCYLCHEKIQSLQNQFQ